ncbi:hypothetical protein ACH5RR_036338 [Cinchona calisaya]|uniref:Uncharacterized protein n=1 Tax=Cinchona calisaya TaxID=153742 RepID=A0ABD2Y7K3_9GENT
MNAPNNEAKRSRTRGRHATAKTAAFFLCILVFSQFCISSAQNNDNNAPSHWSRARKARSFHKVSSFHAASDNNEHVGRDRRETGSDTIFKDDVRLVHTGPNPLHN